MNYNTQIAATHIKELNTIQESKEGIRFGASVTLSQIEGYLKTIVKTTAGNTTIFFLLFCKMYT